LTRELHVGLRSFLEHGKFRAGDSTQSWYVGYHSFLQCWVRPINWR